MEGKFLTKSKIITGEVRFSYVYVFVPSQLSGKYSVSLLIPKSDTDTINMIKKAIQNVYEENKGDKLKSYNPKEMFSILRDGDADPKRKEDPNYKGCYFINANSTTQPEVVDINRKPITDPTEFYSGCYGHASINFYAYTGKGKTGIACGLNNLLKTRDGESFNGRTTASADFGDFTVEDYSVSNNTTNTSDYATSDYGISDEDIPF